MIVAPKSTEVQRAWGSSGIARGTTSASDGVTNTTTLYGFGSTAHPAAYYCKTLATGGYNTWYLPAKNELNTICINRNATPFATSDGGFVVDYYLSSTERVATDVWGQNFINSSQGAYSKSYGSYYIRATRRV